jgi:hypothetical protein
MLSSNTVLLGGHLTIFPLDFQDSCFFLPLFTNVLEVEFSVVRCSNLRPRAASKHPESSRRRDNLPIGSQHRHKSGVDSLQAVAT